MKYSKILFITLFIHSILLFSTVLGEELLPSIHSTAALTIDANSKEIIYAKNIDMRLYPASTTKLITALLLAENKTPQDPLIYSKKAQGQEPFIINLPLQEKISCKNAMDALLLYSANDIAYAIGETISKTPEAFSVLMNQRVATLQLKNTNFITASGLHNKNHYSSAYDLSVITRELFKYPWIMDTLSKKTSSIPLSNGKTLPLKNKNKLLDKDGCIGGKTGYTELAGRCLIAIYEREGRRIVGVVLKSDLDEKDTVVFQDMEKIINWSYTADKKTLSNGSIPLIKNTAISTISFSYKKIPFIGPVKTIALPVMVKEDIKGYINPTGYDIKLNYIDQNLNPLKFNTNKEIGTLTLQLRETSRDYALYPMLSTFDLIKSDFIFYTLIVGGFIILLLFILLYSFTKRKR